MKLLTYLLALALLVSCNEGDFYDIPESTYEGAFDYEANSEYYNYEDNHTQNDLHFGTFDFNLSEYEDNIRMFPRIGWHYDITLSQFDTVRLTNGDEVYGFNIDSRTKWISDSEFRLRGTREMDLRDGSTLVDHYDGIYYADGSITFKFRSTNIDNGNITNTVIEGTPLY